MKYTRSAKLLGISEKWLVWLIALLSLFITALLYSVYVFFISVADPWHFWTDPDRRICFSDVWIWIQILLFSSLTFNNPTKNYLLFEVPVLVHLHHFFKESHKEVTKRKESMYFLLFLLDDKEDPDPELYLWLMDPDPGGPKHIRILRIRIRNTDSYFLTLPYVPALLRRNLTEGFFVWLTLIGRCFAALL
jgi:hypothetical protein